LSFFSGPEGEISVVPAAVVSAAAGEEEAAAVTEREDGFIVDVDIAAIDEEGIDRNEFFAASTAFAAL